MKSAARHPPKPKPMSTFIVFSLNTMRMMVAPRRPRPVVNMPETVPA
jgi:hypothetical protein